MSRKHSSRYAGALVLTIAWGCANLQAPQNQPAASPGVTPQPITPAAPSPEPEPEAQCTPPEHPMPDDPRGEWTRGPHSKLCATLTEAASHDGSYGKTRLLFQADAPSNVRVQHEHAGRFRIFGHAPAVHAFVVGGAFETGAASFIEAVGLVDDQDGEIRWSKYRSPHIVSVVLSPDGESLALIAAPNEAHPAYDLWLYILSTDALYRLGPAPAPPPTDFACEHAYPSRWLDMERNDGYEDMEPGVIVFAPESVLRVTYGRDTCKARAKQRRTRAWDLTHLGKPLRQPPAEDE